MKMNTLEKLYNCLDKLSPQVLMDEAVRKRAEKPILRMLELSR
jgi:quinolinate synthase